MKIASTLKLAAMEVLKSLALKRNSIPSPEEAAKISIAGINGKEAETIIEKFKRYEGLKGITSRLEPAKTNWLKALDNVEQFRDAKKKTIEELEEKECGLINLVFQAQSEYEGVQKEASEFFGIENDINGKVESVNLDDYTLVCCKNQIRWADPDAEQLHVTIDILFNEQRKRARMVQELQALRYFQWINEYQNWALNREKNIEGVRFSKEQEPRRPLPVEWKDVVKVLKENPGMMDEAKIAFSNIEGKK